jgi:hypothetical protein
MMAGNLLIKKHMNHKVSIPAQYEKHWLKTGSTGSWSLVGNGSEILKKC